MRTQTELAWAAGAIDGEGCVAIRTSRSANTKRPQYGLYLAVGNTDPRMPQRLAEMFGGAVILKDAKHRRRAMFEWRVFSSKAAAILKEIRPYLVIKGEQADIAIAFGATLRVKGSWKNVGDALEMREEMRRNIRLLKVQEVA